MTSNAAPTATGREHLGLSAVVLFGLAYLAPLIVLGTYGVVSQASHGATAGSYLLALVAMLFTAASYGKMAARHPVAGSAYAYVSQAIDRRVGFMIGWAVMLDYLFLPMVIWLIGAVYLRDQFPKIPAPVFVLMFIASSTILNIVGFRVAKSANLLLMIFQALVIVLFVGLAFAFVASGQGAAGLVNPAPFVNPATALGPIAAGAAIAAYSFLGFDAVTTLSEETRNARRTLPIAIWLVAGIGGGVFILVAYAAQLAHPGFAFTDPAAAADQIALAIGGLAFKSFFLAGMVLAQFASGLAAQAAGARLIHAMARDGVLPKRLLGQLDPRFGTPKAAIVLTGMVGLMALFLSVESSTSFINFGAFSAFCAVNLAVIATALRDGLRPTGFKLVGWFLAPLAGGTIDAWLLTRLEAPALILGVTWLTLGLAVLVYLTGGFRRPPPALSIEEL